MSASEAYSEHPSVGSETLSPVPGGGGGYDLPGASINKSSLGSLPSTGEEDGTLLGLTGLGLAGILGATSRRKNKKINE